MRCLILLFVSFFVLSTASAADFYWINGSGNWSDKGHWTNNQLSMQPAEQLPGISDNVFIQAENDDFEIIITDDIQVGNLFWESGTISGDDNISVSINGDMVTLESVNDQFKGNWILSGVGVLKIRHHSSGNFVLQNGEYILKESVETNGNLTIESGKLSANNYQIHIDSFVASKSGKQEINISNCTFILKNWEVAKNNERTVVAKNNRALYKEEVISQILFAKEFDFVSTYKYGKPKAATSIDLIELKHPCGAIEGEITVHVSGTAPFNYQLHSMTTGLMLDTTTNSSSVTFTSSNIDNGTLFSDSYGVIMAGGPFEGRDLFAMNALSIDGVDVIDESGAGNDDGRIIMHVSGGYFGRTNNGSDLYDYTWDDPAEGTVVDSSYRNLTAGAYDVTVSDPYSMCPDVSQAGIIVNVAGPAVDPVIDSVHYYGACDGDSTGQIEVFVTGTGNIEYKLYNGTDTTRQTNDSAFVDLPAGTYEIYVTDDNGSAAYASNPVELIDFTLDSTEVNHVTCIGNNDGKITFHCVGGEKPYSFTLKLDGGATVGPQADSLFENLEDGKYYGTITDANGCIVDPGKIVIDDPDDIGFRVPKATSTNVTPCAWDDNGSITIHAYWGAEGIEYSIDGGTTWQEDSVFSPLAEAVYQLRIRNANGCIIDGGPWAVNAPDSLAIDTVTVVDITDCYGDSDGEIHITLDPAAPGEPAVFYSISGDSDYDNDPDFTGLTAGTYDVWVQDQNGTGCKLNYGNVTVDQPAEIVINDIDITDVTCNGYADGQIVIDAVGGTGSLQYSKDGGATWQGSNTFAGLLAGDFDLAIKDDNACQKDSTVTVDQPAAIVFDPADTDATCFGGADGQITVTVTSGGTAPFKYRIDAGAWQDSNVFGGLTAGDYIIEVQDANLCVSNDSTVTVGQATEVTAAPSATNTSCNGGSDGEIEVTAGGGTPPYEYSKDGGTTWQSSNIFTGLIPGDYDIQVRDAFLCESAVNPTNVGQPAEVVPNAVSTPATCFGGSDGSITVNPTGGTAPYQYRIDGGTWQTSNQFTGLLAGDYDIEVRDAIPCVSAVEVVTVGQATEVVLADTTITDVNCNGGNTGQIVVTAGGGTAPYEYRINGGAWQVSNTFAGLSAGTYVVEIKDANDCTSSGDNVVVDETSEVVIDDVTVTHITCNGNGDGQLQVSASGGTAPYEYSNDNGATWQAGDTFTNLDGGTYTLLVRDANLCESQTREETINEPDLVDFTAVDTDPSCNGSTDGQIVVTASGGTAPYEYRINAGAWQASNTFANLDDGVYNVEVQDANNCMSPSKPSTLTDPLAVSIDGAVPTDASCFGYNDGQIVVTASGGTAPYQYSSDNGTTYQVDNTLTGLVAGTYDVVVKDANNCESASTPVVIDEPTEVVLADTTITHVNCNGANTGQIVVTAGGGTAPYEYRIDGGAWQGSNTFSNLAAGSYQIQIQDAGNCTSTAATIVINQSSEVVIDNVVVTDITCNGDDDGQLQITASGGTAPYEYSNDNGATWQAGDTFTNLAGGTYTIIVRDANLCESQTREETIIEPELVDFTAVDTNPSCNGSNDGQIVVTATGGTAPYEYRINGGAWQASNTFTGLGEGNYNVEVQDANNCLSPSKISALTAPTAVIIDSAVPTDVECNGESNGTITVTASGGTAPYQYSSDNGTSWQTNNVLSGLAAGTYDVVVRDDNLCESGSTSVDVDEPAEITFTMDTTHVGCLGGNDGEIVVHAAGGTAVYEYSKDGGNSWQASNIFSNLTAGTYVIQVRDDVPCYSTTATVVINPGASVVIDDVDKTHPLCHGESNGVMIITASGGTPPYMYSVDDGANWQSSNTFSNLPAGAYRVKARDDNSCESDARKESLVDPDSLGFTATPTDVTCFGDTDGRIVVGVFGGTGPYEYSKDGGVSWQTSNTFLNLVAGVYPIQVRDANMCLSVIQNITIGEPTEVEIDNIDVTDATCFGDIDGGLVIHASGGTPPYEYSIDDGLSWQADSVFTDLPSDIYTVIVRDANLCESDSEDVYVGEPNEITFSTNSTPATCYGGNDGQIEVSALGGTPPYEYSIDGGSTWQSSDTFTGLTAGTYNVVVRDSEGCTSSTVDVQVGQPAQITFNTVPTHVACFGDTNGQIEVTNAAGGSGAGWQYSIDGGAWQASNLFTNLAAGTYGIMVQDGIGCESDVDSVEITQPDSISIVLVDSLLSCGSLPVIESDTLQLPDGTGATYTSTINYSEFDEGQILNSQDDINNIFVEIEHSWVSDLDMELVCPNGQTLTIMSTAGGGRDLGEPVPDESGVAGTGYLYSFTHLAATNWTAAIAGGESHDYVDNLGNNITNASYIPAGEYNPVGNVSDLVGCPLNGDWSLRVKDNVAFDDGYIFKWGIRFNPSAYPEGYCNGMLEVNATGGTGELTYDWSDGQSGAQITDLCSDLYTVTVTDANGCTATFADSVYDVDIEMIVTDTTHVLCAGESNGAATVTATGGNEPYEFQWPDGNTGATNNNLSEGWYQITVVDGNGCEYVDSLEIRAQFDLQLTFSDTVDILCNEASVGDSTGGATVHATGGTAPYNFLWSSGETDSVATNLIAGWNFVTVSDANCTVVDSILLDTPSVVEIIDTAIVDNICFGGSDGEITITADGGTPSYEYSIDGGVTWQADPVFTGLAAGHFDLMVRDSYGCGSEILEVIVDQAEEIDFDLIPTDALCPGGPDGTITVENETGGSGAGWEYSIDTATTWQADSIFTGLVPGTYGIMVRDGNGCESSIKEDSVGNPDSVHVVLVDSLLSCGSLPIIEADTLALPDGTGVTYTRSITYTEFDEGQTLNAPEDINSIFLNIEHSWLNDLDVELVCPNGQSVDIIANGSSGSHDLGEPVDNEDGVAGDGYLYSFSHLAAISWSDAVNANSYHSYTDNEGTYYPNALYIPAGEYKPAGDLTNLVGCPMNGDWTIRVRDNYALDDGYLFKWGIRFDPVTYPEGYCNGMLEIEATGGTGDYTYQWSDGQTNSMATDLCSDYYTVTVTDGNGCAVTFSDSVYDVDIEMIVTDTTHVTCAGYNDGSATLSATGGNEPYEFIWPNGDTTATQNNLETGWYQITVLDGNGCEYVDSFEIVSIYSLSAVYSDTIPVLCSPANYGDTTGGVTITPVGGTAPYTFAWSSGDNDSIATQLTVGWNYVTVEDANCQYVDSIYMDYPDTIDISVVSHVDVACYNDTSGSVEIAVTGGTIPYGLEWSTGDTAVYVLNNLGADDYSVTVTDANACWQDTTVTITEPVDSVDFIVNITNSDCGVDNGAANVSNISGGTPGYVVHWYNSAMVEIGTGNNITDLSIGQYFVGVEDLNACETIKSFIIENNTDLQITGISTIDPVSCYGECDRVDSVTFTGGVAPFEFLWSNGDTTQTAYNLCGDSLYWVVVIDANTCQDSVSYTTSQPTPLTVSIVDSANSNCWGEPGGEATAEAVGGTPGYSYIWTDMDGDTVATTAIATNLYADTVYTVKAIDTMGCVAYATVQLTQPATPITATIDTTQTDCGSSIGMAVITPTGGTPFTVGDPYVIEWEDGQAGDTAFNLAVGSYEVTVTDSLGCIYIDTAIIEDNSDIEIIVDSTTEILCAGDCTGSAYITVNGGTGDFIFEWSNGVDTEDAVDTLCAGVNMVTVTDLNTTCSEVAEITIVEPAQILTIDTVIVDSVLCYGDTTGGAAIVVSGGTPADTIPLYTYLWEDGATDSVRTNLEAGTYTVTAFDANMCEAIYTFNVYEPDAITYDVDIDTADCGIANGAIYISNIQGASGEFEVTWSHETWTVDSVGLSITNLSVGVYTMTITDTINGCTLVDQIQVPDNSDMDITLENLIDPSCAGTCDGEVEVSVTGGTPDYTFLWSNGDTTAIADSLCAGEVSVTVTDINSCQRIYVDTLYEPDSIQSVFIYTNPIVCAGDTLADLYAQATGGTGDFEYIWTDTAGNTVSTDSTLINAAAGQRYFLTITDENMCAYIDSIDITDEPTPIELTLTTEMTGCPEDSSGWALVTPVGGVEPYSYNWFDMVSPLTVIDGAATDSAYNLPVGTYVVEVTDFLGCTAYDTAVIQSNTDLDYSVEIIEEVYCIGVDNGVATIPPTSIVNGTGPYSYYWASGEETDTAYNLAGGLQYVTLTDEFTGCAVIKEFNMPTDQALFVASISGPDYDVTPDVGTGFIQLSASGGFEPYEYSWADSNGTPIDDDDELVDNLDAGWYYWTVTDAQSCSWIDSTEVLLSPIGYDTIQIQHVSCFGGNDGFIEILPTGGVPGNYTVTWQYDGWTVDSVGTSISNLVAGTYNFTISDAGLGSEAFSIEITQPDEIAISFSFDLAGCDFADGEIKAQIEGGTEPIEINWDYNGFPLLGDYGLAWAWPEDTVVVGDTIDQLHVGMYYYTLTDANGCSVIDSVFLDDNSNFVINAGAFNPNCYGETTGQITITPQNGVYPFDYNWSHNSELADSIAAGLSGGVYSITVIDDDMCVDDSTFVLIEPDSVIVSTSNMIEPQCFEDFNGAITFNAQGGTGVFDYSLKLVSDVTYTEYADSVVTGLPVGQYAYMVSDEKNCLSEVGYFLMESESPQILMTPDFIEYPNCPLTEDGELGITVQAGMFDAPIPETFASLTYKWWVDSLTLAEEWHVADTSPYYDSIISETNLITNARAGKYWVEVTNEYGCSMTELIDLRSDTILNVYMEISNPLDLDTSLTSIEACKYDKVYLYAIPGASLLSGDGIDYDTAYWYKGYGLYETHSVRDSAYLDATGSFYFGVRVEAGGCYIEDSIRAIVPNVPDVDVISDDDDNEVPLSGGVTLTASDYSGYDFIRDTRYTWDEYYEVDGTVPELPTIDWDYSDNIVEANGLMDSTIYRVTVENQALVESDRYCVTRDSIKIAVMGEFGPPLAFSPNGDGQFDTWQLNGIDTDGDFTIQIFNRWGQMIFESTDASQMVYQGWDGKNKFGKEVSIGSYYYVVKFFNGIKNVSKQGIVTVIR